MGVGLHMSRMQQTSLEALIPRTPLLSDLHKCSLHNLQDISDGDMSVILRLGELERCVLWQAAVAGALCMLWSVAVPGRAGARRAVAGRRGRRAVPAFIAGRATSNCSCVGKEDLMF